MSCTHKAVLYINSDTNTRGFLSAEAAIPWSDSSMKSPQASRIRKPE